MYTHTYTSTSTATYTYVHTYIYIHVYTDINRVETFLGPFVFFFVPFFPFGREGSRTGNCHTNRGDRPCTNRGCRRKTQNCRRFWPPLLSSRLNSVYRHRDWGSWSRNSELSALLVSPVVLPPQKGSKFVFCSSFLLVLWIFFRDRSLELRL